MNLIDNFIQIYPKNPVIGQQFAIYGLSNTSQYSISLWESFNYSQNVNKSLKFQSNICQFNTLSKNNIKQLSHWFIVPCKCVPIHSKSNSFYLLQIKNSSKSFNEIYRLSFLNQSNFDQKNKILSINYENINSSQIYHNKLKLFHSFYIQLNLIEINHFNLKNCSINNINKNEVIEQNKYELELRYRPFEMSNTLMFFSNNTTNSLIVDYLYNIQENNNNVNKFGFGKLITKKLINFLNGENTTLLEFECWHFVKPGYYAIISNNSNIKILVKFLLYLKIYKNLELRMDIN